MTTTDFLRNLDKEQLVKMMLFLASDYADLSFQITAQPKTSMDVCSYYDRMITEMFTDEEL